MAATNKNKTTKAVVSKSAVRTRKLNRKNKKKVVKTNTTIPNSFVLLGRALRHLWRNKKLFGGIFLVYVVLYTLLVKGLATNFQIEETRELIEESIGEELQGVTAATTLFGALIGTAGATASESGSVYQLILFVIFSLVIIKALRVSFEGKGNLKIKEAFYGSTSQLIPYVLVIIVIVLQLLPALIGTVIYNIIVSSGIAVNTFQQIVAFILLMLFMAISIYWVSSSVFASYIVTLDRMTPMQAFRSARKLVKFRRWSLLRKVLFLPFILLLFFGLLFLPLVLFLPVVAEILFLLSSLALIYVVHAYLYELYRELL